MVYYAGIGSRETPQDVCQKMRLVARDLANEGYVLRSGGAKGADTAFAEGTEHKVIYTADDKIPLWARVFTDFFHPNPTALKPYSRKLMHRNAMQILGDYGDEPVEFIVCWTKDGKRLGGTAQAMRIAEYYNIPIYNLAIQGDLEKLYANHTNR